MASDKILCLNQINTNPGQIKNIGVSFVVAFAYAYSNTFAHVQSPMTGIGKNNK